MTQPTAELLREARDAIVKLTNQVDANCSLCGGPAYHTGKGHDDDCVVARLEAAAHGSDNAERFPRPVTVRDCARCGGTHSDLTFRKFSRPAGGSDEWTHWVPCPATGEPIIMQVTDDEDDCGHTDISGSQSSPGATEHQET